MSRINIDSVVVAKAIWLDCVKVAWVSVHLNTCIVGEARLQATVTPGSEPAKW